MGQPEVSNNASEKAYFKGCMWAMAGRGADQKTTASQITCQSIPIERTASVAAMIAICRPRG